MSDETESGNADTHSRNREIAFADYESKPKLTSDDLAKKFNAKNAWMIERMQAAGLSPEDIQAVLEDE